MLLSTTPLIILVIITSSSIIPEKKTPLYLSRFLQKTFKLLLIAWVQEKKVLIRKVDFS